MRVLGLASQISALSSEAAAAIEEAGLLGSLATELRNPSDLLACAAALEVGLSSELSPLLVAFNSLAREVSPV